MDEEIIEFAKLVPKTSLDGDKMAMDLILNKPIIITGYQVSPSKYADKSTKDCVKVQFYLANDVDKVRHVFFTGSNVIKDNLNMAKEAITAKGLDFKFKAVVRKVGNYYCIA